jgi:hypothetical protein
MDVPTTASWVERLAAGIDRRASRRGFLARVGIVATALAFNPGGFLLRPRSAYASVCGEGSSCSTGWSVFCCTIAGGRNECPPGSFVAGWWRADGTSFCTGGTRYYIDCNARCDSPCSCGCPSGTCDNRRTCCNQFRYGQCHQEIGCYGPVVCRIVTCTPPWIWDRSCTTAAAVSNGTGTHNAPCLSSSSLADVVESPVIGRRADGRIEVVQTGPDGRIRQRTEVPGGGWSPWKDFGDRCVRAAKIATNADGRLEVFFLGVDQRVYHRWEVTPNGPWSEPVPLGGTVWSNAHGLSVLRARSGELRAFIVAGDSTLWTCSQVAAGREWASWLSLGGFHRANPSVGMNLDGRLEVFAVADDRAVYSAYQLSDGSWYGYKRLGGDHRCNPTVVSNGDGRLEVFTVSADRGLWHAWQETPGGGWSGWNPRGGTLPEGFSPAVVTNADGRLEVFTRSDDGTVYHQWQLTPGGGWGPWEPLTSGCPPQHHPVVGKRSDGRLVVFVERDDRHLFTAEQVSPGGGWSGLNPI